VSTGVIFDFHNTLVRPDSLTAWLVEAAHDTARSPVDVDAVRPVLREVWSRASLRYPDGAWDLDPARHKQVFLDVLTQESPCPPDVASALYDAMPAHWVAVDGAVALLTSLRERGVRLAIVSNIAVDIRPRLAELGMLRFFDTVVLSYEVGVVKPDRRLFQRAVDDLRVAPSRCVMVGDSPGSDGGAVAAGVCTILVPVVDDRPQLDRAAALLAGVG